MNSGTSKVVCLCLCICVRYVSVLAAIPKRTTHTPSLSHSLSLLACYVCWFVMLCLLACSVFGTTKLNAEFLFFCRCCFSCVDDKRGERRAGKKGAYTYVCACVSVFTCTSIHFPFRLGPSMSTSDLHAYTHSLCSRSRDDERQRERA